MLLHEVTATNFIRSTVLMSKVFWKSSNTELFFSLHCLAPQLKHTWKISCLFTCVVTAFLRAGNPCNLYKKNFYHILRLKQSYLWGTQVDWCCVAILTLLLSFVATKKPLIHFFRCYFMFIPRFTHDSIRMYLFLTILRSSKFLYPMVCFMFHWCVKHPVICNVGTDNNLSSIQVINSTFKISLHKLALPNDNNCNVKNVRSESALCASNTKTSAKARYFSFSG